MLFGKKRVYLDYAAGASPNASSPHQEGRRSREMLEGARLAIARLVEAKADDVIFTSGATEANALAILGSVRAARSSHFSAHVLYHHGAHASIVENVAILEREGAVAEALPIKNAHVDCAALAKMLRPETVLVAMEAVCGETGVIWNTREVAHVLREAAGKFESRIGLAAGALSNFAAAKRPLLHVDASQAPLTEKILRAHFDADMMTLDGSKVGAVRGIGALIAARRIPLAPLYGGGGQERGLRPGSEAPELASAFAAALRSAAEGRESFRIRAEGMRAELVAKTSSIPNLFINEAGGTGLPAGRQAPHILNISLPGRDTDYLVTLLDEAGFAVSTRSACETDSLEGSRAVLALTGDLERAKATLRVSWGPSTPSRDLDRFAAALRQAAAFLDENLTS